MNDTFDFVIVGGGTAGPQLAQCLANTKAAPTVLLLEGGPDISKILSLAPYDRFTNAVLNPSLSYPYMTAPQLGLDGNSRHYFRGKGLGGSSAINYAGYMLGSDADYDRWADIVGDESFRWERVKERFKKIETFHSESPDGTEEFVNPKSEDHGHHGPVDIALPKEWEEGQKEVLEAARDFGFPLCADQNSGNPIGFGVTASTLYHGRRVTSATANLRGRLKNLSIWTDAKVNKIILEGKIAKGVEIDDGRKAFAKHEVILTAGTIDTPKILLLSGIGPADELNKHSIPIKHELAGIGRNVQDHNIVFIVAAITPGFRDGRYKFDKDKTLVDKAREQYEKDATGPLTMHYSGCNTSWLRDDSIHNTPEFKNLDQDVQTYLRSPTVPLYEWLDSCPLIPPDAKVPEGCSYWSMGCAQMNPQSRGSITLASPDPSEPPIIDPKYHTDPTGYDRMTARVAIRKLMNFMQRSTVGEKYFKQWISAPKSTSDEDLDEYICAAALPVFHINGSVMMGKKENKMACVDTRFRVFGIDKLRVGDLSVCPLTPNTHTQSTAYLMGQTAAEKMIEDYDLEKGDSF